MNLFKINLKWFLISLFIGLFLVYCSTPTPKIIVKHPTLNSEEVFRDDVDNCYKYKHKEVECPQNSELINKIPIVVNDEE